MGALTAFAALEAFFIKASLPGGALACAALVLLGLALPVGVLAFSPLQWAPDWLHLTETPQDASADALFAPETIVSYSHQELVMNLDRYLGGGMTATKYLEDLVQFILVRAGSAARKKRLFKVSCVLVGLGQLAVLGLLLAS